MFIDQIVNSVFNSNTYILSAKLENHCWLIDCGDADILINWITKHKKNLKGIFITHGHFDHIYGINKIMAAFPDCQIYTSQKGKENLYSEKLNISRYSGDGFIYQYNNISIIKENDTFELFPGLFLNIIETPGHDWSSLTFNVENHLFTGDSFLPDYKLNTKFPKGVRVQAEDSLLKIYNKIRLGAINIYPGHGNIKFSYTINDIM